MPQEEDGKMGIRVERIEQRLKELDEALHELNRYRNITPEALRCDLSLKWIIERGLISAASSIFDVSDHILSSQFGFYSNTYDESLLGLFDKKVISEDIFQQLKGLGSLRNALVHRYMEISPDQLVEDYHKAMIVFPRFAMEILSWIDSAPAS